MTLMDPWFLEVGVALTLLLMLGLRSHDGRRRRLADFIGGQRAVYRLSRSDLSRVRIERMLLLGVGGLALAVAAAEPHWSGSAELEPPVKSVVLAIDVSASMQAPDVQPTRLAQAVEVASDLLDALQDHRLGLLLFAGTGYAVAPPTNDHEALRFFLEGTTPTIASAYDPGSLLSVGIEEAVALLEREASPLVGAGFSTVGAGSAADEREGERLIVVISDGESAENEEVVSRAVQMAVGAGIGIHAVGVGTDQGTGMIMPPGAYQVGGPVVDASGEAGTSRIEEASLRVIAEGAGGRYTNAGSGAGLRALRAELEETGSIQAQNLVEAPPWWAGYDLPFVLGVGALVLILLESLLDVILPGSWYAALRKRA
jgi:Ca-activated chloride channel family protein